MMLGDVAEAKHHFDVLTEHDPAAHPQIYAEWRLLLRAQDLG